MEKDTYYLMMAAGEMQPNEIQICLLDIICSYLTFLSHKKLEEKELKKKGLLTISIHGIWRDFVHLSIVFHRINEISKEKAESYSAIKALYLSADIEYALILFRAIYDSIAVIINNITRKGPIPESFEGLINKIESKPGDLLEDEYKSLVIEAKEWFLKIREMRVGIEHFNKEPIIIFNEGKYMFAFDIDFQFKEILDPLSLHLNKIIALLNKLGETVYSLLAQEGTFTVFPIRIGSPYMNELSEIVGFKTYKNDS